MLAFSSSCCFGFTYWTIDDYLIARSDRMVASQLNFIAGLPEERRPEAIDQHLKQAFPGRSVCRTVRRGWPQDSGNLEQFPPGLKMNDSAQGVSVRRTLAAAPGDRVIRAIARTCRMAARW